MTPDTALSTNRTTLGTSANVEVSSHLDPGERQPSPSQHSAGDTTSGQAATTNVPPNSYDCPVTLGLLSIGEAAMLVSSFQVHLDPMIALLDPVLHTLDRVRSESPCLLSSMVAAASKFFRPDLHRNLMDHSLAIVSRAVAAGACDTGLVQSLMIHVYWKSPTDRTAWVKLGMAIRMAYQLRWHEKQASQDELPEMDLRRLLDSERTWYCLCCFDLSYSHTFQLPRTISISQLGDIRNWLDGHRCLRLAIDNHLASSIEALALQEQWEWLRTSSISPRELNGTHIPELRRRVARHRDKWYTHFDDMNSMSLVEATLLNWLTTERTLDMERHAIGSCVSSDELDGCMQRCLAIITEQVEGVEALLQLAVLRYLQDVASILLSKTTTFISEFFVQFSSAQQTRALAYLRRIYETCIQSAAGDQNAATAFVARFVRRTLRQMTSETTTLPSRAMSREPEVAFGQVEPSQSGPDSFLTEFDQVLNATWLPENSVIDDEYWATLFSGVNNGLP